MITKEQIKQERASLALLHANFVEHAAIHGEGHSVGSIILALVGASGCIASAAGLPAERWVALVDTLRDAAVENWERMDRMDSANDH